MKSMVAAFYRKSADEADLAGSSRLSLKALERPRLGAYADGWGPWDEAIARGIIKTHESKMASLERGYRIG